MLPALSVHAPVGWTLAASGPLYANEVHDAIPEIGSVPLQSTLRPWSYQPFASGGRVAPACTVGDVASYRNESGGGDALLPAWSVQPPIELALALSGPLYVSVALQESMPEVASVPLQLIETGRLYQPSWSAGRAGLTATVGGAES